VADEPSSSPNPFDVQTVRLLAGLMSRHDLSEIDLTDGSRRIRIRRGARGSVALPPTVTLAPVVPQPAADAPSRAGPTAGARNLVEIKSPGPGTFYAREKPEAAPYVTLGSRVKPETVVGLIAAMKLYNEITADCSGVIAEVLVENEQHLEYGQVLFRVDPTGVA
jgi:acetyl-CoA carboxylase biotin carboxyl carrier protein